MWPALVGLVAVLLTAAPVCAADPPAAAPSGAVAPAVAVAPPAVAPPPAVIKYFNRDIATLRAPYYGLIPADRAIQSANRIRDAVAKDGPGTVKTATTSEGLTFTIDGVYVFRMLPGDLDAEDGQTFEEAAKVVGKRLQEAIAAAHDSVRGRALLRELAVSLGATLGLGAVLWLLVRFRRWLRRRIDAYMARRLHLAQLERSTITRSIRIAGHFVFLAMVVVLAEEWLRFVFGLFPYTRPWSQQLTGFGGVVAGRIAGAAVDAAPGLVMVTVIAGLAQFVTKILGAFAYGVAAGRYRLPGIDADTVPLARRLAITVVWLFALAMAYPYLPGSGSEAFKGLSVLVGLMLSLGASGLVGQAAGGIILTFGRVLRPGEWVRVGEVEGVVTTVGMFSTRIRTPIDEDVNVPNSMLLSSTVRNFSRPVRAEASMLEITVTIGYSAPWRQVHAMLLEGAARTAEIERDPPPYVLQTALSDYYVQYSLRVRLRDQLQRPAVLSALNAHVQDVFNEYGVQIMSPHYVLDPAAPVVVPKEHWFEPPARPDGR